MLAADVPEQLLHRTFLGRVATVGHRHAPSALDFFGHCVEAFGIPCRHDNDKALASELHGEGVSESRSDAHDQRDFR